MCRWTLNVLFLVSGITIRNVKIVVGDTPLLSGVAAAADGDVYFRLNTEQVNAPPTLR